MPRRRKRRSRKPLLGEKGRSSFVGVSALMLVVIMCLIVPSARRHGIPTDKAVYLTLFLWIFSIFAVWACLRSRRRRYKHGREHYTTRTDYSSDDDDVSSRRASSDERSGG